MRRYLRFLFLLAVGPSCSGQMPFGSQNGINGICSTASGDVNTHILVGVWKKIPDPNDPDEMANFAEGTYKLLYIVDGVPEGQQGIKGPLAPATPLPGFIQIYYNNSICEKTVTGGKTPKNREAEITKLGLYFSGNKRIATNILDVIAAQEDPETLPVETYWTNYKFTGGCGGTRLQISKGLLGGKAEKYEFFASDPPIDSCK